jgi:hypothetical protein
MTDAQQGVACPACGKRHRWEPPLARRLVRCDCGQVMRMPAEADGLALLDPGPVADVAAPAAPVPAPAEPRDDGTYELADLPAAPPAPAPTPARRCPACGASMAPAAALCLDCGYHVESGQRLGTAVAADGADAPPAAPVPTSAAFGGPPPEHPLARPAHEDEAPATLEPLGAERFDPFNDRTLPLILIAIGVGVTFVQAAFLQTPSKSLGVPPPGVLQGLYEVVVTTGITAALLVAVAVGLARVADVSFGPLGPAVLKLLAIALAPQALGFVAMKMLGGGIGGWGIGLIATVFLYWALTVRLFAFDRQRTFYTVLIVFAVTAVVTLVRGVLTCVASML